MACTLSTILACLQLYADVQMYVADGGVERYAFWAVDSGTVAIQPNLRGEFKQENDAANPYGRFELGVRLQVSRPCFGYAAAWHQSSLATGRDRGVNAGALGLRCDLPFRFGVRR